MGTPHAGRRSSLLILQACRYYSVSGTVSTSLNHLYSGNGTIMAFFDLFYTDNGIAVSWNEVSLNTQKKQEYRNDVFES